MKTLIRMPAYGVLNVPAARLSPYHTGRRNPNIPCTLRETSLAQSIQGGWPSNGRKGVVFVPKLRVGVIGAGMAFERLHYPAYMQLMDTYEIVAVCDPDQEKLSKWSRRIRGHVALIHSTTKTTTVALMKNHIQPGRIGPA